VQQQLATLSTGSKGLYTVVDTPRVPNRPVSLSKTFLLAGGIGVATGLIAAIGYFIILVRLDQSLYSRVDIPGVTVYPVQVQIPRLPRRSIQWAPKSSGRFFLKKGKQR
jgi:hypothetical protein